MEFQDKVVLITGAGRGTGRQMAESFAAQGARVAINDISPQNVESLAAELKQRGYNAKVYVDDIAKKVAVQALVNRVEEDFGRIDVLINHAFVEPHASLLDMDEWDWHRTLDVNLTGAFLAMQSVGPSCVNEAAVSSSTWPRSRAAPLYSTAPPMSPACSASSALPVRRRANYSRTASASTRWGKADLTYFREGLVNRVPCPRTRHGWQRRG